MKHQYFMEVSEKLAHTIDLLEQAKSKFEEMADLQDKDFFEDELHISVERAKMRFDTDNDLMRELLHNANNYIDEININVINTKYEQQAD